MLEWFSEFFSSKSFMPHGHCYLWKPGLVWLQALSNGLIGLSYMAIASCLAYLVYKGRYVPFKAMALAFGIFIVSCGFTHFFDVYVIWEPIYWTDGAVRAVTAIASVGTALMLPPLIPKAIRLSRSAQATRERGFELEEALQEMEANYQRIQELEEQRTRFFANVSHELRTPLTLILGPLDRLLGQSELHDDARADLELVRGNARLLLKHVNDLLDVARLDAGLLEVRRRRVDLAERVRVLCGHFEGLAEERGIEFRREIPPTLMADVDPDRLERVVLNLLGNAFKFTPFDGVVSCRLDLIEGGEAGERLRLEIADSGPGVPEEQRERVFERFQQSNDPSTRRFGGTGLGLAIVREFVELHGGEVAVGDAREGGAAFEVLLPVDAPEVEATSEEPSQEEELRVPEARDVDVDALISREFDREPPSEPAPAIDPSTPHVLVVEDNADLNAFIRSALGPTYHTTAAHNGAEGLELARRSTPDLVITDLMMPELDGEGLLRALREDPSLARVPVIALTARSEEQMRVRLLRLGAQDYIQKPFSVEELVARVTNHVQLKRTRDVLSTELTTHRGGIDTLAQELAERSRALETALESMRVAREQAERASELKSRFLATISHELRTPLASLLLQIEELRLEAAEGAPPSQPVLDDMRGSAARLAGIIDGLIEHARLEAGRIRLDVRPLDPIGLAEDVVGELRGAADSAGLDLGVEIATEVHTWRSDPTLLRLILVNLVSNAVKFTPEGSVTLRVDVADDELHLTVIDTGPGIPAEEQSRIFEPFEQLEGTRHKHTPGVGLGLAIVQEMATALGGVIILESHPGDGSSFDLVLPEEPPTYLYEDES